MGILFSLTTINLLNAYGSNTLNTTLSTEQADLKQQQLKAMVGDTEGQSSPDSYGIYFETGRYILFKGMAYSASDPLNFSIDLNRDLQFSSIQLPNSQIVFTKNSGEVSNYNANFDNVTLKNINTNQTKTIRINQYGAVIDVY
ncbi:hypothetical protein A2767_04620 [Candidatus Roizmanbacteria bacterium RIFCSPHIGHO2_01_FULL_35_10]|nr:MAG: hypothetical protein A2767_04620 [Candidatus Roizmanbacteria bacterium RIFCSPHIGHO2_01_FULL_35_10]